MLLCCDPNINRWQLDHAGLNFTIATTTTATITATNAPTATPTATPTTMTSPRRNTGQRSGQLNAFHDAHRVRFNDFNITQARDVHHHNHGQPPGEESPALSTERLSSDE